MSQATCVRIREVNRGDALIEALIAILLMATLGLGLAYTAGRALHSQRTMAAQGLAIAEMREALQEVDLASSGLCETGSGTTLDYVIAGRTITFEVTCAQSSVTMGEVDLSVRLPTAIESQSTEDSIALFGEDGRIVFTLQ
jgi:Tfp pilus assembly protein PilV